MLTRVFRDRVNWPGMRGYLLDVNAKQCYTEGDEK